MIHNQILLVKVQEELKLNIIINKMEKIFLQLRIYLELSFNKVKDINELGIINNNLILSSY